MGYFRFRRRLKLFPGCYWNIGRRSSSLSVGTKGYHKCFSRRGTRTTYSLPGSGLSYSDYSPRGHTAKPPPSSGSPDPGPDGKGKGKGKGCGCGCAPILGLILLFTLFSHCSHCSRPSDRSTAAASGAVIASAAEKDISSRSSPSPTPAPAVEVRQAPPDPPLSLPVPAHRHRSPARLTSRRH
jgi:hypothetical protein